MVRTTTDDSTPEELAAEYAADQTQENFDDVVDAVGEEYIRDGHSPFTDVGVLTPVGLAVRLCGNALGYDAGATINFDGDDEVAVKYDSFEQGDPHATPIDIVRLAGQADEAAGRRVRFRNGAGLVRIYVDVPERREDDD